ncbi:MAG TPA: hypothetical protein VEI53_11880 [Ktedonobacteraceae bacterium]|nr:hypothetical protein [Ktedonobacteraceae bacterium]
MSDFDISNIQDLDRVEITDLDVQARGFSDSVTIPLLRFTRTLPFISNPRGRFTLLVYLICAVMLLFMIQPALPGIPKQPSGTSTHEIQYPLAVYPFTIKHTSSAHPVTWIRISNGQIIVVQASPGETAWHQCKVQRGFTPLKYAHSTFVVCT